MTMAKHGRKTGQYEDQLVTHQVVHGKHRPGPLGHVQAKYDEPLTSPQGPRHIGRTGVAASLLLDFNASPARNPNAKRQRAAKVGERHRNDEARFFRHGTAIRRGRSEQKYSPTHDEGHSFAE